MDRENVTKICTFDTALGWCGLAWRGEAAVGFQLPEVSRAETKKSLLKGLGQSQEVELDDAPAWVQDAAGRSQRHLQAGGEDLTEIPVDLTGVTEFYRRVYVAAMAIPSGQTVTYGELAARIGSPGAARAVGQALGRNPLALIVPCHRITAASGKPGGFSAPGGLKTKARILAVESAAASGSSGRYLWQALDATLAD